MDRLVPRATGYKDRLSIGRLLDRGQGRDGLVQPAMDLGAGAEAQLIDQSLRCPDGGGRSLEVSTVGLDFGLLAEQLAVFQRVNPV